jgi:alpha-amylase
VWLYLQFHDHYFDKKLKHQIKELVQVRLRNHINAESKIEIKIAEADMYLAIIADCLILKLGSRYPHSIFLEKDG